MSTAVDNGSEEIWLDLHKTLPKPLLVTAPLEMQRGVWGSFIEILRQLGFRDAIRGAGLRPEV